MYLRKLNYVAFLNWKSQIFQAQNYCSDVAFKIKNAYLLSKYLKISDSKAKFLCLKHPAIRNLDEQKMRELMETFYKLGYPKEILVNEPVLFCHLPVTLRFRHQVLSECGIQEITPRHLATYLPLVKQTTVRELKNKGEILPHINVENRLASFMTQWPTSLTTAIHGDMNDFNLYTLRLKIIQKHLELVIGLTNEEFLRGIQTYPTARHRPLAVINETLTILQSEINMPLKKIKSNFYLIHADPDNLKQILHKLRTIGGIDVREVIKMYPKIALKNYSTLVEMKNVFKEFEISDEAQRRCFDIYTLSPDTIRERLNKAKDIPEFETFLKHPRFLKIIHFKKTAMKRLKSLYGNNKKCLSLNILSGCSAHYEVYEKSPGDRMGKGKDLIFCIAQCFENKYSSIQIRKNIKRHPYWINIPLVQVQYVYKKLASDFSSQDIYDNCTILLYPWNKIRDMLALFNSKEKNKMLKHNVLEQVDSDTLSKTQKLSLVLYLLEHNHYFSGNGVWTEEKLGSAVNVN